jgi:ABC-type branched-subunit amino acid transport system substrate-binding protein
MHLGAACTPTKGTNKPRPRPTRTDPTPTSSTGKVDTIKWTNTDPKTNPPITDSGKVNTSGTKPTKPQNARGKYTIGLVLPFQTGSFKTTSTALPDKSDLALQFYGGLQIALEEVSEEINTDLKIEVVDSDLTDEIMKTAITKVNIDNWDVAIGPMRGSQVQILANKIQSSGKVLISPQSIQADLVKNYPQMVQYSVSLQNHCKAIGQYAMAKYKGEQIVLVCREKEKERLAYFTQIHGWPGASVRILVLPDATATVTQSLKSYLTAGKTTAFILPSFGSQDFVNGFLTKLRADKGKNEVAVFGLPQWEDFSQIEYELFADQNVHITRDYWWDAEGPVFKAFQKKFFERYGTVPNETAVKGYDIARWTALGLDREGLSWASTGEAYQGLGFKILLNSVIGADGKPHYTENTGVRILRFEDYRLLPVEGL